MSCFCLLGFGAVLSPHLAPSLVSRLSWTSSAAREILTPSLAPCCFHRHNCCQFTPPLLGSGARRQTRAPPGTLLLPPHRSRPLSLPQAFPIIHTHSPCKARRVHTVRILQGGQRAYDEQGVTHRLAQHGLLQHKLPLLVLLTIIQTVPPCKMLTVYVWVCGIFKGGVSSY